MAKLIMEKNISKLAVTPSLVCEQGIIFYLILLSYNYHFLFCLILFIFVLIFRSFSWCLYISGNRIKILYGCWCRPTTILNITKWGEDFRISTTTKILEQGTCERSGYISSLVCWFKFSIFHETVMESRKVPLWVRDIFYCCSYHVLMLLAQAKLF